MTDANQITSVSKNDAQASADEVGRKPAGRQPNGLLVVVGVLTAVTGLCSGMIAFWGADPLSDIQRSYYEKLLSVFMLGSMGLIGLLGGRALQDKEKR